MIEMDTIDLDGTSTDVSMTDDSTVNRSTLDESANGTSYGRIDAHKRKASAVEVPNAKRFKDHSTSNDVLVENESQAATSIAMIDQPVKKRIEASEIDFKSSRFQPNLILARMTKEELDMHLNPNTNVKVQVLNSEVMECVAEPISIDESNDDVLTVESAECELEPCQDNGRPHHSMLRSGQTVHVACMNENDAAQVQPPRADAISNERQSDPNLIDYNSWQWQPKLRLTRLTEDVLKDGERFQQQTNQSSPGTWLQVNPIEFDKDESLIRELSPQTASQQFQKRMNEIMKSGRSGCALPSNVDKVERSKQRYLEYEETHKQLQAKTRSNGKKGVRRLYSQDMEYSDQKENMEFTEMESGKKRLRNGIQSDRKMLTRSAKKLTGLDDV